ncbi:hypothetical protein GCM10029964_088390 [Kibdelosporangium lantanae]
MAQTRSSASDRVSETTPAAESPIDPLSNRPATTRGHRIAFARVNGGAAGDTDAVQTLRPMLDDAVAQLAGKVRGAARLRFPHYALAVWLLGLTIPADVEAEDEERVIAAAFRQHVRRHSRVGPTGSAVADSWNIAQDFPLWIRLVIRLAPRVGLALTALRWRPQKWISHQQVDLRPRQGIYQLARAFVRDKLREKYPDAVGDLLVRAFLEDLRHSYRRWTLWGTGRRRTGYPWLLVDGVTDTNAGMFLLETIARARNTADDTIPGGRSWHARRLSRLDPLLVVAAGEGDGAADIPRVHPADAPAGYRDWLHRLARSENWILLFDTDACAPAPGVAGELTNGAAAAAASGGGTAGTGPARGGVDSRSVRQPRSL